MPIRHAGAVAAVAVALSLVVACGTPENTVRARMSRPTSTGQPADSATVRLLFVGDIMLGRGVAPVASLDPEGLFEDVRFVVSDADVAVGNLESPLTDRPHTRPGFALEAAPESAGSLALAGFDVMGIANNHSGDAGPESVLDTIEALQAAGLGAVGGGEDARAAAAPLFIDVSGLRIALLTFDASGAGHRADAGPGINPWSVEAALASLSDARRSADIVAVGLHGGIEYSPIPDPQLTRLGRLLADEGADIVWGHGPHVSQPVEVWWSAPGNATVIAPSLGNFIFDQRRPSTTRGTVLEVLVSNDGVLAYRTGGAEHRDLRVHFAGWDLPRSDAGLLDRAWWSVVQRPALTGSWSPIDLPFPHGDVVGASAGDVDADGRRDLAIAYRHPFRPNPINELHPEHDFEDAQGRSAHVGLFEPGSFDPIWGAGTLFRPIEEVAACHGAMAVAYSELDDRAVVATGAWTWIEFGFVVSETLPGPGIIGCADIDGDGRTEPVVGGRRE